VAGVRWSQQSKLTEAAQALEGWQEDAQQLGVSVTQINLTLLDDPEHPEQGGAMVVFEWDANHGEYAFRTAGG